MAQDARFFRVSFSFGNVCRRGQEVLQHPNFPGALCNRKGDAFPIRMEAKAGELTPAQGKLNHFGLTAGGRNAPHLARISRVVLRQALVLAEKEVAIIGQPNQSLELLPFRQPQNLFGFPARNRNN